MPQTRTKRRPTPPAKTKTPPPSKLWIPALMFSLILIGVTVIVTNYFGLLVGGQNNWFLLIGIGEVTIGFVVATMLR
ncbi:MAG: cell division protein CrgA [Acidimicrobiia bacterium]